MALIGIQAQQFLESDLGRYLQGCAEQEQQEAMNAFLLMDASDTAAVRRVQLQAAVSSQVITWLAEAIENGDQAEQQLEALDEDN